MGLFSKLFGKRKNSAELSDEQIIEAGACPNCWGHNEYDGLYIAAVKDQTKSSINGERKHQKAFVQKFIENNVTGIRLKKDGDKQSCPECKTKYKYVSSHAN